MTDALLEALEVARSDFLDALGEVDAALVTAPGVVEAWSVRDLVVHVAFWSEHGADALALATSGRGAEFAYDTSETDAMNARLSAESAVVAPWAALEREANAYARFRDAIGTLDLALLSLRLGNGDTVEQVIRYDGPDHYAEHAAHIRDWFGTDDEADDDPEVAG
jgi:hypothetical protein